MAFVSENKISPNQFLIRENGYTIHIKREDLIHSEISGNKYRKLKYNVVEAQQRGFQTMLTFGGAFSNHLAAVAAMGRKTGMHTIGLVRGEEWEQTFHTNPTLQFCHENGMQLHFLNRSDYTQKETLPYVQKTLRKDPTIYLLPEGGTNDLAVKGCEEILTESDHTFDTICCSVGTGGTLAGLIKAAHRDQYILGFPALRNLELQSTLQKWVQKSQWELINDYTFGGYAKVNTTLVQFLNDFHKKFHIPLDPIYTGKMVFGIFDLIKKRQWQWGNNILIIHTGGVQGILGMNQRLLQKGMATIAF